VTGEGRGDLAGRITALSPQRRALLERLRGGRGGGVGRRGAGVAAPLSYSQRRLWFLDQLDPGSTAYTLPYAVRLAGPLDVAALRAALAAMVERHEVLRTAFPAVDGLPSQVAAAPVELAVADLAAGPAGGREAAALHLARQEAARPFDLAAGPLCRPLLARLDDQDHLLILTMHHIVSDGWSMGVLIRELTALYAAFSAGAADPLPPLPVQYGDYALWQLGRQGTPALARELQFWRQALAGAPALLELPADRPRPGRLSERGAVLDFRLSHALADDLAALGRSCGATMFMTLLAGFAALASRYSGQQDLCIGTPVAGRIRPELEDLAGFFVNTLVLRIASSPRMTFRDLLARTRDVTLAAFEHQEVPFEQLVEELRPARDPSRTPLFQVMFILQNAPAPPLDMPGLAATPVPLHNGTAKFDLTLEVTPGPEGVRASIEYATDLFDRQRIEHMADHYTTLLAAAAASPDLPVARLPLLTPAQRHQVLATWNDTASPTPFTPVHELIAAQARRTPNATAVTSPGTTLTYAELDTRANHLARTLTTNGIGPETLVGLLADRDADYLVALLAILKAGGAYLPLDPAYPVSRLGRMIRHSGCPLVIAGRGYTRTAEEALRAAGTSAGQQRLAELPELLVATSSVPTALPHRCGPRQLAYVLYTSGSTGTPKGVMVEHAGLANHVRAKIEDLGITAADVVAQNGPQGFDVSVWQFLAALTCGGRVEVLPDDVARDPVRLLAEIDHRQVSVVQVVPSMLRELVREVQAGPPLAGLRWIVPTGDALPAALCQQWLALHPGIPLLNTYGSTECSDDQCHLAVRQPPGPQEPSPIVSIGRPIANMRAYVLSADLELVPPEIPGELYIGGIGVGRGYLSAAGLTAERFLPDPFSTVPGARLYRTGDRARSGRDGKLEFLGRTDHVLKVRGFRIDPGEIEAALCQQPAVQDAIVTAVADETGNKRLVAYVVTADQAETPAPPGPLRDVLRAQLPEHMVPSAFVPLAQWPLNANGKVDRAALPQPDLGLARRDRVPPRTPTEREVTAIWAEVLATDLVISVDDGFFELGGHSLLATQVASRLQRSFGMAVPLQLIFDADTVAGLAAEIDRMLAEEDGLAELVDQVAGLTDEDVERLIGEPGASA
jgi:amino acid adenylation domain-containing protein